MKKVSTVICLLGSLILNAQYCYWQQQVDYKMDVKVDVEKYRYSGSQELTYKNNSPDTLRKVYYHLYFNAFQPDSEMNARLQTISDPDMRMVLARKDSSSSKFESRISLLASNERGYLNINSLYQNNAKLNYKVEGTILEVTLEEPILPQTTSNFKMEFEGQVPLQIRRSGRDNADGIKLSMSQWYPKMAEYDFQGWHTDPYIGREFYGVWGNFDVKITIDKNYIIGGSGYLQNANEIGFGYQENGARVKKTKGKYKTWHFLAPQVHDFTWAADKDFVHDKLTREDGVVLHFLYKNNPSIKENWQKIQEPISKVMSFYNSLVGKYPWKQYSFIQGGDGGMEYAMCTLITGGEIYGNLEGTAIHELAHSWFQHALATNESKHPWMDEGFTSYISQRAKIHLYGSEKKNSFDEAYAFYLGFVGKGVEEPLTTHSDHYEYNFTYSIAAYIKGELFLSQLGYIIGENNLDKTFRRFFDDFKMKHPSPNDIIRSAEKVSGIHLGWYRNEWIETTHTIDYAIENIISEGEKTSVILKRVGRMPMPIEFLVTQKNGDQKLYYIPLREMRSEKREFDLHPEILKDWAWAYPSYTAEIDIPKDQIKSVEIDPKGFMADINKENNNYKAE